MPPAKQSKLNMFHCGLNDKLIESNYSHLANKMFKNLALPPGLIVNKPMIQNVSICKSKDSCTECIDDKQMNQLYELSEVKSESKDNKVCEVKPIKPTRKNNYKKNKKRKKSRKK